jgi:hypothetical protein
VRNVLFAKATFIVQQGSVQALNQTKRQRMLQGEEKMLKDEIPDSRDDRNHSVRRISSACIELHFLQSCIGFAAFDEPRGISVRLINHGLRRINGIASQRFFSNSACRLGQQQRWS